MQASTSSTPIPAASYTERAQRHKDGSVLLSIADDCICKLNGVGALTWMVLQENPAGLSVDEVVRELNHQFETINAEGTLHYEVSREQLWHDTQWFLKNITEKKLLLVKNNSRGQELYYIKEGVTGTTLSTDGAPDKPSSDTKQGESTSLSATAIRPLKRETFSAFIGLLYFDLILKFAGFQSLINKVEQWPTAVPRATTNLEQCQRVRAIVDRAQMYYPKKAMCLQHSAVVTCLLRRRGVPAELVLAAQEFPPKGHAWAEVDGTVINDVQTVKNSHRVLKRI
ncbi:MAG TPA: lasso peptide biosynthesis B2 protein [Pyrinomonadaceae bacterium]|jgi:hypothetical protein|nr:lasso peptide biosynthesis B2 protein [Pyrinomonadaceae bacterium]